MKCVLKALKRLAGSIKSLGMVLAAAGLIVVLYPARAHAMHIMEGFLPLGWCLFWTALSLPFLLAGLVSMRKRMQEDPRFKLLMGLAGAFAFALSALKLPSVAGSSSHPTGVGLGAVLFGPTIMTVIGSVVLLFQAVLLAHGGLTTLGANVFSMAVAGPFVAYFVYGACCRIGLGSLWGAGAAAFFGSIATYLVTAVQLALAFPSESGGVMMSFAKFSSVFLVAQLPLSLAEAVLTAMVLKGLIGVAQGELETLGVIQVRGEG